MARGRGREGRRQRERRDEEEAGHGLGLLACWLLVAVLGSVRVSKRRGRGGGVRRCMAWRGLDGLLGFMRRGRGGIWMRSDPGPIGCARRSRSRGGRQRTQRTTQRTANSAQAKAHTDTAQSRGKQQQSSMTRRRRNVHKNNQGRGAGKAGLPPYFSHNISGDSRGVSWANHRRPRTFTHSTGKAALID